MKRIQRQSILCPNCRKLISSDITHCPYCGEKHPGSVWKNNRLTGILMDGDQIIRMILYTNITMYILSLLLNPQLSNISMNPLHLLSPDNRSLFLLGATGTVPINQLHSWWTVVSANYLHGGVFHILFNMIAFKQLAPLVIQEYGGYRTVIIYTFSGVLGFVVSYFAGIAFTIGASAAVCGLMGAILYFGKSRGGQYGQAVYSQIGVWAVTLFIFGFIVPGINNWGHGGGMISGMLLGFILGYKGKRKDSALHKGVAFASVIITAIVLIWETGTAFFFYFLI